MSKSNFHDFTVGDRVFHLSNRNTKMVVIEMTDDVDRQYIKCRWLDNQGKINTSTFIPEELKLSNE